MSMLLGFSNATGRLYEQHEENPLPGVMNAYMPVKEFFIMMSINIIRKAGIYEAERLY